MRLNQFLATEIVIGSLVLLPASALAQTQAAASPDFFETNIRPVLAGYCYGCHTESALGGLRLDSREDMLKGGQRGIAVVPGDPDNSLLIKAIRQTDPGLKMPLGGKLKDSEVADFAAWIKAGAVWPKAVISAKPNTSAKYEISPSRRSFWSFLPLQNPTTPEVKDPKWAKTDIDRFIFAKLDHEGIKPVGAASKLDLLRRASLDLTGLPPTPEEISAFEKDNSPGAFARVVDRLLASPHYESGGGVSGWMSPGMGKTTIAVLIRTRKATA